MDINQSSLNFLGKTTRQYGRHASVCRLCRLSFGRMHNRNKLRICKGERKRRHYAPSKLFWNIVKEQTNADFGEEQVGHEWIWDWQGHLLNRRVATTCLQRHQSWLLKSNCHATFAARWYGYGHQFRSSCWGWGLFQYQHWALREEASQDWDWIRPASYKNKKKGVPTTCWSINTGGLEGLWKVLHLIESFSLRNRPGVVFLQETSLHIAAMDWHTILSWKRQGYKGYMTGARENWLET